MRPNRSDLTRVPRSLGRALFGRDASPVDVAIALGVPLAFGALFVAPAMKATGFAPPAPLDDVFIHFNFARAAATGHPFEWIGGQGYASGETAPLYAALLAFGYAVGFRGEALGFFALAIAFVAGVSASASLRTLARLGAHEDREPRHRTVASALLALASAAMLFAIGTIGWSFFSGMETALACALVLALLVSAQRACDAEGPARVDAEWRVAWLGTLLVLTRPEAPTLVFAMALLVARHAYERSAVVSLLRTAGAPALATLVVSATHFALTGDFAAAGARLKLLSSNPFLTDVDRARELVLNLVHLGVRVLGGAMAPFAGVAWLWALTVLAAAAAPKTRGLALATLFGALAWALLVSWNGAARFQNFRYYVPPLALIVASAAMGIGVLSRLRRIGNAAAAGVALALAIGASTALPREVAFFRDASANIHGQQVEVGRRLAARMREGERVLVGDAGAIPYVSRHGAIDALGLGGYRRLPFVRAAVWGEAATLELLERLAPDERPRTMALYPSWFPELTSRFGKEFDRVTIENNVICGGPTKVLYDADFQLLGAPEDQDAPPFGAHGASGADDERAVEGAGHVRDVLDVADVVSEEAHAYVSPAPDGGFAVVRVRRCRSGAERFDGGRVVPLGKSERFVARVDAETLWVRFTLDERSDAAVMPTNIFDATVLREGAVRARASFDTRTEAGAGSWPIASARFEPKIGAGDTVVLTARTAAYTNHKVWFVSER
jgi:hypothetical protein